MEELYDDIFNNLPKEKQLKLIGRKDDFAKKAGIGIVNIIIHDGIASYAYFHDAIDFIRN